LENATETEPARKIWIEKHKKLKTSDPLSGLRRKNEKVY